VPKHDLFTMQPGDTGKPPRIPEHLLPRLSLPRADRGPAGAARTGPGEYRNTQKCVLPGGGSTVCLEMGRPAIVHRDLPGGRPEWTLTNITGFENAI
jgi:hypothetical protein